MSESAHFFTIPRGVSDRAADRVLGASFRVERTDAASGRATFMDTFDRRLHRAGCALVVSSGVASLEDRGTGEVRARGTVPAGAVILRTSDFAPGELAARVPELAGPRALVEIAGATMSEHELEVFHGRSLVARVRVQSVSMRSGTRVRRIRGATLLPATAGGRVWGRRVHEVEVALTRARWRRAPRGVVDRALAASGVRPAPHPARPGSDLTPDMPLRAAARAIFLRLLDVMKRNQPGMHDDIDPEFLHDYRVALRRTRTGLSLFREAVAPEVAREFRARFARIAAATGQLRDLDVQLTRRDEYAAMVPAALRGGFAPVFARVGEEREEARAALLEVLDHPSHERLMRDWSRAVRALGAGENVGLAAETPALEAARTLLRRRYARVRKIASAPATLDDAALHRARIECKKMRYLLEFFSRLLGPDAGGAIALLSRAQDALGQYNDASVQMRELSALVRDVAPPRAEALSSAAVGAIVAALDARRNKLRARCERRLAALSRRKVKHTFQVLADANRRRKQ